MATDPAHYRYPLDLGQENVSQYPFVQLQIAKFRERVLTKDYDGKSSVADTNAFRNALAGQVAASTLGGGLNNGLMTPAIAASLNTALLNSTVTAADAEILADIFLPLPQNFENNYKIDWEMANGQVANGLLDFLNAPNDDEALSRLGKGLGAMVFGGVTQRFAALTPNPKKQALFNGIEPRVFTLNYTFSPQNLKEAQAIHAIIKTVQKFALPTLTNTSDAFFGFPSEFIVKFHNTTAFPAIQWCVCTDVQENFAPNTMQLLTSGHTVQVGFTITLIETSLRTQQDPGFNSGDFG